MTVVLAAGRRVDWVSEEKWEQSEDENYGAERNEMDERDGKEEGDDGGGEKERSVRRLVGQMGKEWEDSVSTSELWMSSDTAIILKQRRRHTQSP